MTMAPDRWDEAAREVWHDIQRLKLGFLTGGLLTGRDVMKSETHLITDLARRAYAEGLERAAVIAAPWSTDSGLQGDVCGLAIADAIREEKAR